MGRLSVAYGRYIEFDTRHSFEFLSEDVHSLCGQVKYPVELSRKLAAKTRQRSRLPELCSKFSSFVEICCGVETIYRVTRWRVNLVRCICDG